MRGGVFELFARVRREALVLAMRAQGGAHPIGQLRSPGPGLMLHDRNGEPRAQLEVGEEGPRLYMEDEHAPTIGHYLSDDPAKTISANKSGVSHPPGLLRRIYGLIPAAD
jgi:hypothetical protein